MSTQKTIALEKYLQSNSDQYYFQSRDSSLFNSQGTLPGDKRIRFFVETVDEDGVNIPYSYHGNTFMGLVLLINPSSVNVNLAKIVSRSQTMTSFVEEHWGEELDTITFTGSGAAFIWGGPAQKEPLGPIKATSEEIRTLYNNYMQIPDLGTNEPVGPGDHSGLTVKRRRNTLSYDEFRKMVWLMQGNGAEFDLHGLVRERYFIQLSYDLVSYRGYFESMDITETADNPFRFIYTITFKSEKTVYSYLG